MTQPASPAADTMNVWVSRNYGDPGVLALEERARPRPGPGDVLIRLKATTVTSADVRLRSLHMPRGFRTLSRLMLGVRRLRQPVLGSEFSGVVEAAGPDVSGYRPGDAVVGFADLGLRCHAEYRLMPGNGLLAHKPANLSFAEGSSLFFGGTTARHFLRRAALQAGDEILVLGAAGAVGSAMVQLARHAGAQVTALTSSRNAALMEGLGATAVIDYTRQDFTSLPNRYDVIADTVGCSSFARCRPVLKESGRYLAMAADLWGTLPHRAGSRRSIGGVATARPEDIRELTALAASGIFRPVIGHEFPFHHLPEAHALVETGHKCGNAVILL